MKEKSKLSEDIKAKDEKFDKEMEQYNLEIEVLKKSILTGEEEK
ncbi:hypothetical protein GA0061094_3178 [[Bacillus] enclensis]|uniref:Uncharacterized protein n=1 Tax=[Bacillus] enclensis TaxID=1402860 RepID=A0A1C4CRZ3_9BACI|nr:hypothetical protein [[Bacillus] enclensis]SCC21916.1 hypothetical protein GA0061094_3178 [[Bacillus] enclensis]